jgi:hypothetical protein
MLGVPLALFFLPVTKRVMDKDKKNRSGSQSNPNGKNENMADRRQQYQPGAPNKSNRQSRDHEKDDSSGAEKNTTKKQSNSI